MQSNANLNLENCYVGFLINQHNNPEHSNTHS